ncbi:stress responsive alpha-beta barrel [Erwinia sp. OLTSP20]|uniref:Dabb family protein n=1 Tax=unclassified Erwinia TaxID=2622719 RepID=UPI000C18AD65|nr:MULTISPECIES: Dabb family protein [unclassified Erwinia]PIJ49401.1 stress responsive alpha-beta barrel [Erwinia sp. OAMSP11]PIJ71077.1 stress responsive alpha-beta barrel [Erwinia sp. OLSSP12]PIJ79355.1 stress responsive alpha-beta barrel [Erwinia sp. OLCASP19]PIJ80893.1 stress responsive alpha-beta barrel [Erwinia sp. OLMTSP26]PIJ83695.1 stress responsive alpha-beta barrel [Erwinia sp. OLMDSP33]
MSKTTGLLFFLLIFISSHVQGENGVMFNNLSQQREVIGEAAFTAKDYKPRLVKHIVLFKYKPDVTAAQRDEVVSRFMSLSHSVRPGESSPYILYIVEGVQNSGEGADNGFEQGFIVTFKSEGDRNYYVGKPLVKTPGYYDEAHDAFKQFVAPLLSKDNGVLVFDFSLK